MRRMRKEKKKKELVEAVLLLPRPLWPLPLLLVLALRSLLLSRGLHPLLCSQTSTSSLFWRLPLAWVPLPSWLRGAGRRSSLL